VAYYIDTDVWIEKFLHKRFTHANDGGIRVTVNVNGSCVWIYTN
jgi:hypothetical protein